MLNFLFWNTNRRPIEDVIAAIANENAVDILILAEWTNPITGLLAELNKDQEYKFEQSHKILKEQEKISVFTRFDQERVKLIAIDDSAGVQIYNCLQPLFGEILIVAVHMPSKLHCKTEEYIYFSTRLMQVILEAEQHVGHTNTILIGDFNMNPFEAGIVGADGLHAIMDRAVAKRISRTVKERKCYFFYNPRLSLFGDNTPGPSGTYYYSGSNQINYFWNMFDQVLIRPSLLSIFSKEDVQIISSSKEYNLVNRSGLPVSRRFSDHLPILFRLRV